MELTLPYVDGIDPPRAAREQKLGEAAGRGAHIEADAIVRIESEMVERSRKLHAPARHPRIGLLGAQYSVDRNFFRRLGDRNIVRHHQARRDGGLRLGAALEQAALDQQTIDTNTMS
jgi:hypothetical protein